MSLQSCCLYPTIKTPFSKSTNRYEDKFLNICLSWIIMLLHKCSKNLKCYFHLKYMAVILFENEKVRHIFIIFTLLTIKKRLHTHTLYQRLIFKGKLLNSSQAYFNCSSWSSSFYPPKMALSRIRVGEQTSLVIRGLITWGFTVRGYLIITTACS